MAEQPKEKFLYLESLRGIAALGVVLFHASFSTFKDVPGLGSLLVSNLYLMVDFFFVLSGFVIAHSYLHKLNGLSDVLAYQWRRFWRLYPLHVLLLLVFLLLEWDIWRSAPAAMIEPGLEPFANNDPLAFLAHALMIHPFTEPGLTFNMPSWSIAVEFYTYAIFGFLCLIAVTMRQRMMLFSVAIVAATLVLWPTGGGDITQGPEALARCIFAFLIGVLTQMTYRSVPQLPWLLAPALIAAVCALLAFKPGGMPEMLFAPLFALVILSLVRSPDSRTIRILNRPVLVWTGTMSFGIYMWHKAVFWVLLMLFWRGTDHEALISFRYREGEIVGFGALEQTLLFAVALAFTFLLAMLTHRFVERPGQALGARLFTRRSASSVLQEGADAARSAG